MKKYTTKIKYTLATASVALIPTIIYDLVKEKPILSTIGNFISSIWNFLLSVVNFEIRLWIIIIAVLLYFIIKKVFKNFVDNSDFNPPFIDYKEERFKNWKWTWRWQFNSIEKVWDIENLRPHCPNCDTPIILDQSSIITKYICPRCNYSAHGENCDDQLKVTHVIFDNAERLKNK